MRELHIIRARTVGEGLRFEHFCHSRCPSQTLRLRSLFDSKDQSFVSADPSIEIVLFPLSRSPPLGDFTGGSIVSSILFRSVWETFLRYGRMAGFGTPIIACGDASADFGDPSTVGDPDSMISWEFTRFNCCIEESGLIHISSSASLDSSRMVIGSKIDCCLSPFFGVSVVLLRE